VDITVNQPVATLYYIEVDHLNTPRLIEDSNQQVVWRSDQQEPFGDNVPNENPSGFGAFEFPLRFPGQYADKETNLAYNWLRNFNASLGRYVESDPVGLRGGLNTYVYVLADPLRRIDPRGEAGEWVDPSGPPAMPVDNNYTPYPDCPANNCRDPIIINWSGVCKANDAMCGQAMRAAGIQPPYYPETKTYSLYCLVTFGVGLKATGSVGITLAFEGAKRLGIRGVGGAAAVVNNPVTTVATGAYALDAVFKHCECEVK